jgi:hypothetical protein
VCVCLYVRLGTKASSYYVVVKKVYIIIIHDNVTEGVLNVHVLQ